MAAHPDNGGGAGSRPGSRAPSRGQLLTPIQDGDSANGLASLYLDMRGGSGGAPMRFDDRSALALAEVMAQHQVATVMGAKEASCRSTLLLHVAVTAAAAIAASASNAAAADADADADTGPPSPITTAVTTSPEPTRGRRGGGAAAAITTELG